MKKIEAIIRKTKFEEVKEALLAADIEWFTYTEVRGVGKARQDRIYRGVMYGTDIIERIRLTIIVRDRNVDKTIVAVMDSARTGDVGDGRVFISDVIDTYSIRTGESGDSTLFITTDSKSENN